MLEMIFYYTWWLILISIVSIIEVIILYYILVIIQKILNKWKTMSIMAYEISKMTMEEEYIAHRLYNSLMNKWDDLNRLKEIYNNKDK